MNQNLQFGNHPDAESLNAFVEQALPPEEREQILAHMASCSRCRQVVFLVQETADTESLHLVAAAAAQVPDHSASLPRLAGSRSAEPVVRRKAWLAGWRWAWIPATAMAGILSVVMFQHLRRTPQNNQVAQNAPMEQREQKPVASATPAKPAAPEVANKVEKYLDAPTPAAKGPQNIADEKKKSAEITGRPVPQAAPALGFAAPPVALGSLQSRREVNGMVSGIGGPAKSAQFGQQQAAQQRASGSQPVQVAGARYSAAEADALGSATSPTASNGMMAMSQLKPAPPAPAPQAPRREMALKSSGGTGYGSVSGLLSIDKAKSTVLPHGTSALSVATNGGHTIAIDATGAMFLSEDAGKNWVPIARQWTGRAILVRTRQTAAGAGAAPAPPINGFELVTDTLETWESQDGKTWVLQRAPLK